jgi:uncharacterized protein YndB with AHSA1/START domain
MAVQFEVARHFPADPDRVFEALTDLDGASAWMPGLVKIEPADAARMTVGTRWRETRRMFGHEATEEFEVTTVDAPRRLGLRVDGTKGSSKRGEYLFDYSLKPSDGGTEVVLNAQIRGLSGIAAFVGRLFVGPFKKAVTRDLDALSLYLDKSKQS